MSARRKRVACGAFAGAVCVAYGCSLGLDASKIGAGPIDASPPPPPDASSSDGAFADVAEDSSPAETGAPACVHDSDCTSANACRVGKCTGGTCAYVVCPAGACQGSSCSAASTCSVPTSYGFHAAQVSVTAGAVGCGGNAPACVAAAYPFVFVGTTNGVVAYAVNDPSNGTPPVVPVKGLPFLPSFITAMGARVYFVGAAQGGGPTRRVQIGWIDVPSDPLTTPLQATTVFASVSISGLGAAWAATDGSLFLIDEDPSLNFPAANVAPPLTDEAPITFFPSPSIPSGAQPIAASGSRFVVSRWAGAATPYQIFFSLETGAATAQAQNSGEQPTFTPMGPTAAQAAYAQGGDGSVLWNAASLVIDDGGGNDIASVRLAWLVASGTATQFLPSPTPPAPPDIVDVELYAPPIPLGQNAVVGPVAWVDSTTALVLAAAAGTFGPASPGQTSVQVALTTPKPALAAGRRFVVPQSVGQVGAAASGAFGYVLAADASGASPATTCTLHIFAPSCAGSP